MENQVILGTYNINSEILKKLTDNFADTDIIMQNITNIKKLKDDDLFSTPDILLIDFDYMISDLLEDLKDVIYNKKMVIAALGNSLTNSCATYKLLYNTDANIVISNNIIKTIANTMRRFKNANSLMDGFTIMDIMGDAIEMIPKKEYIELLRRIIAFIETKDHYTKGHCERTSKYASFLAEALNLSDAQRELIYETSMIHDIGKIGIPDAILTKEGRLTPVEFDIVKQHAAIITELLPEKHFSKIKKIARAHHERYDGTGYPDGLIGEGIPFESRIIGIVDSFDAMTTRRGYNQVKTFDEAKEDIIRYSGSQFDPKLAEVFAILLDVNIEIRMYFDDQKENLGKQCSR